MILTNKQIELLSRFAGKPKDHDYSCPGYGCTTECKCVGGLLWVDDTEDGYGLERDGLLVKVAVTNALEWGGDARGIVARMRPVYAITEKGARVLQGLTRLYMVVFRQAVWATSAEAAAEEVVYSDALALEDLTAIPMDGTSSIIVAGGWTGELVYSELEEIFPPVINRGDAIYDYSTLTDEQRAVCERIAGRLNRRTQFQVKVDVSDVPKR
jgi:hypothetical protein